ncbi:hypothetical protein P7C73_g3711, partial [Tremellales sp. Uapishka_1]
MLSLYLTLLTFLATLVSAQDDAWHLDYVYTLVNEELDPVVSPNGQGSHMHKVIGGANFGASYNYDTYNAATCSSLRVQADKSNYWMPNLYYHDSSTSKYVPIPAVIRFYYFLGRSSPSELVKPYPKGFRMIAGSPNNKAPTSVATFTCQINSDFTNSIIRTDFNFQRDCPYGMKTELFFPPCWDGVNLYLKDGSHVSYPTGGGTRDGSCPFSHPVRLPAIQLEYTWHVEQYLPGATLAGNMYWANGDSTGYGIHGDFVNGWDLDILGAALNSTACGIGGGNAIPMDQCPILNASFDDSAAKACRPALGTLAEPNGNTDLVGIPALPGCNLPWGTSGSKPTCSPAVAGLDVSHFQGTDGAYVVPDNERMDIQLPTTGGWHEIACVKNIGSVIGGNSYTDASMTRESCQASCLKEGYSYAATGEVGAWNCVCGTGVSPDAPLSPGSCTVACPGNSSEACGGSYLFQVYYAPNGTVSDLALASTHDGATILGCYQNPGTVSAGLLGSATYSFTSNAMTTEVCLQACEGKNASWAATTSGKACYCGVDFNFGTGSFTQDSYCTVACTGNSTEICGDYYRSTVYNITGANIAKNNYYHPAGWQGCYAEGSGHLALQNNSWSGAGNTVLGCINGCSELGYTYAGLEYGSQCFCGDTFNGGQKLPSSQCSMACSGNSTGVCGGTNTLDLYTMAAATITHTSEAAKKPESGYIGCFVDSGTSSALTAYSYSSNSMTIETCLKACAGFSYTYGGVENGNTCKCGNSAPTTRQMPTELSCTTKCAGNSSETCGAGGYVEAYAISNSTLSSTGSLSDPAYQGCYSDSSKGLTAYTFSYTNMTISQCRTGCMELGYSLSGVDGGNTCYCGNSWGGGQVLPDSSCPTKCPGNATQTCGGSSFISLWKTAGAPAVPTQATGWIGCWADQSSPRTLTAYSYTASPMSGKVCRAACTNLGYTYAGTENGNQCFCDNKLASVSGRLPTSLCTATCAGSTTGEKCGGSYRLDLYNATGGAVSNGLAGYQGCYTDDSSLNAYSYSSDYISVDICNTICYAKGYAYGGVRNGAQCKCGNSSPSTLTATSACANPCTANSTENCGTSSTIAVYKLANTGVSSDFVLSVNSSGFAGCFKEGATRLLSYQAVSSSSMTNALCISNCNSLGYAYAGTEYGSQCFCGNKPNVTSGGYPTAVSDCNQACSGGSGVCGASGTVSLWSIKDSSVSTISLDEGNKGCFAPGTFLSGAAYSYSSSGVTPSLCRRTCKNKGFSIAGITNGNNCVCGNSATYGAAVAPASCAAACTGNSTQTCGGAFSAAFNIYDTTGAGAQVPSGFPTNYIGCYPDQATRSLGNYSYSNSGMTSAQCMRVCQADGYPVYGTENGNQCYCGVAVPSGGLMADSQCSVKCAGLSTEYCGAGYKLSTYNLNTPVTASSSSAVVSSSKAANATSSSSASKAANSTLSSTNKVAAASSVTVAVTSSSKASSITAASSKASSVTAASSSKASSVTAVSSSKASSVTAATSSKASSVTAASSSKASSVTAASSSKASSITAASSGKASSVTAVSTTTSKAASSTTSKAVSSTTSTTTKTASSSTTKAASSSTTKAASSSTTKAASSSTTSKASSTSTAAAATGTDNNYVGCYTQSSLIVSHANMTCTSLTPNMCKLWCQTNSFTYSGMQGGDFCGCTNDITALTSVVPTECNKQCIGDSSFNCGGTGVFSIYKSIVNAANSKRFDGRHTPKRRARGLATF